MMSDVQRMSLSDIISLHKMVTATPSTSTTDPQSAQPSTECRYAAPQTATAASFLQVLSLPSATFYNCTITFNVGTGTATDAQLGDSPRKQRAMIASDSDSDFD